MCFTDQHRGITWEPVRRAGKQARPDPWVRTGILIRSPCGFGSIKLNYLSDGFEEPLITLLFIIAHYAEII